MTSRNIEAFYLKDSLETSLMMTKATLKAPLTPKPAIIFKITNQTKSKDNVYPTIPNVVIPQLINNVFRLPL
jgi:hypothetical protein